MRDPRVLALLFGPPILQLILFGYAVNLDVENARTAWMDMDHTPESRDLLAAFQGSPYFRITAAPSDHTSSPGAHGSWKSAGRYSSPARLFA